MTDEDERFKTLIMPQLYSDLRRANDERLAAERAKRKRENFQVACILAIIFIGVAFAVIL